MLSEMMIKVSFQLLFGNRSRGVGIRGTEATRHRRRLAREVTLSHALPCRELQLKTYTTPTPISTCPLNRRPIAPRSAEPRRAKLCCTGGPSSLSSSGAENEPPGILG